MSWLAVKKSPIRRRQGESMRGAMEERARGVRLVKFQDQMQSNLFQPSRSFRRSRIRYSCFNLLQRLDFLY